MRRILMTAVFVAGAFFTVDSTWSRQKPDVEENYAAIPASAVKIKLPGIQQPDDYSCGAAALMSILSYYGIQPEGYDDLKKGLHTTKKNGTNYKRILRFAKQQGLEVEEHADMTLKELKKYLDDAKPVICSIQAYDDKDQGAARAKIYRERDDFGHYVVAIGYDEHNIYFMDPSLTGRRGYLAQDEFVDRWHDNEGSAKKPKLIRHLGLVIWKKDGNDAYSAFARKID
jgi:predicted double-glycine peptidase